MAYSKEKNIYSDSGFASVFTTAFMHAFLCKQKRLTSQRECSYCQIQNTGHLKILSSINIKGIITQFPEIKFTTVKLHYKLQTELLFPLAIMGRDYCVQGILVLWSLVVF